MTTPVTWCTKISMLALRGGLNTGSKNLTDYEADSAAAQRFFISMLSTILYARGAGLLEENCFRVIDDKEWCDPNTTHENLLRGGRSIAIPRTRGGRRDRALEADAPFIYFRRNSGDQWLERELDHLEREILPAIREKRLGQYLVTCSQPRANCSDEWEWIEVYSMVFCFTETCTVRIAVDWAGTPDTPISSFEEPSRRTFKKFLMARPVIEGDFRIQSFHSFTDGDTVGKTLRVGCPESAKAVAWCGSSLSKTPGSGRAFVQKATSALQNKKGAGSGRIGLLWHVSNADRIQVEKEQRGADEDKKAVTGNKLCRQKGMDWSPKTHPSRRKEQVQMAVRWEAILSDIPDTEPAWIRDTASSPPCAGVSSSPSSDCNLTVFEEDNEELAPTQPLSTQPFSSQSDFVRSFSAKQGVSSQAIHRTMGKRGPGLDASPALPPSSRRRISGHVRTSSTDPL